MSVFLQFCLRGCSIDELRIFGADPSLSLAPTPDHSAFMSGCLKITVTRAPFSGSFCDACQSEVASGCALLISATLRVDSRVELQLFLRGTVHVQATSPQRLPRLPQE